MEQLFDILAIGDVVVDDFIKLKDASVHCKLNNEECEICMRWGDKIPFEFSIRVPAVGNSANAAVSASRLGLTSALHAYVGSDSLGTDCLEALKKNNVSVEYIDQVPEKHTNYHYVLWFESERTILIKHELFDYKVPVVHTAPRWVYLSSLGSNAASYHDDLYVLLSQWPDTKLAFQPGTFQIEFGVQKLLTIYERSDIFFCNKEEAERILGIEPTEDIKRLLSGIKDLGPKNVVITNDRKGAYACDSEKHFYYIPMYPDTRPPYERSGAGDAFASSVVSALAYDKPLEEALLWGPINAMSVVQEIGAQQGLLTKKQLEDFVQHAPDEYKLQNI